MRRTAIRFPDEAAVRRAVRDADGVCYLVHALKHRGFSDLDRVGAAHVRDAASACMVVSDLSRCASTT